MHAHHLATKMRYIANAATHAVKGRQISTQAYKAVHKFVKSKGLPDHFVERHETTPMVHDLSVPGLGFNIGLDRLYAHALSTGLLKGHISGHSVEERIKFRQSMRGSAEHFVNQNKGTNTIFAHVTSIQGLEGILKSKSLIDAEILKAMQPHDSHKSSSGSSAGQPGICIFSDKLGLCATDVINGKNTTPIVFFTIDPSYLHKIHHMRSSIDFGDQCSFKAIEEDSLPVKYLPELPINIIMCSTGDGAFEVKNKEKFVGIMLANILEKTITMDIAFLFKAAFFLNKCGYQLVDNNLKSYKENELHSIEPIKISEIILKTIEIGFQPSQGDSILSLYEKQHLKFHARGTALMNIVDYDNREDLGITGKDRRTLEMVADICTGQHSKAPALRL